MKTGAFGAPRLGNKVQLMMLGRYNPKRATLSAREQRRSEERRQQEREQRRLRRP